MCIVSYISDHYQCPHTAPWQPNTAPWTPSAPVKPWIPSQEPKFPEIDWQKYFEPKKKETPWTPEAWALFKEMLALAAKLDKLLSQPDCEEAEKQKWMSELEQKFGQQISPQKGSTSGRGSEDQKG